MRKARFTDEQIVRTLQEADRDQIAAVAKRHGVSEARFMSGASDLVIWVRMTLNGCATYSRRTVS
jgi:hypothetical protein